MFWLMLWLTLWLKRKVTEHKVDVYRALRYLPVGAAAGMLDAAIVSTLFYMYGRDAALWAAVLGAAIGYPLSFLGHRRFTFGPGLVRLRTHAWKFALLKTPNVLVRIFVALAVMVHQDWWTIALVFIPIWSFVMKRWIFTGTRPWRKAA